MDERRFDAMARVLGMGSVSRRSFGGLLLAGSALVAARSNEALAKRKGNNGKGNSNGKGNNGNGDGKGKGNDKKAKSDARCPAGKAFLSDDACPDKDSVCRADAAATCNCAQTTSNARACIVTEAVECPEVDQCKRDKDCGSGQVCVRIGGCCRGSSANACVPKCPSS